MNIGDERRVVEFEPLDGKAQPLVEPAAEPVETDDRTREEAGASV